MADFSKIIYQSALNKQNRPKPNLTLIKRQGGPVHMQVGGALNLLKAAERASAGKKAADVARAIDPMRMSEALGNLNLEGKGLLRVTQSDRTRVGGGNIGGAMFPGLQQVDPNYAGAAWGVGNKATASRLIQQSDPNTVWSTVLGSEDQLKTNPLVFNKLRREFTTAMKEGKLSDELAAKINQNLSLKFGEGADIRDPKIWQKADTFEKRALLADVMMGQGIPPKKGGVSLGGEKSGKGVIFKPTEILKRETEPLLLHPEHGGDVPTFAVGPRLFTLSGETQLRPDLHPGFPYILQGEDTGMVFKPAPGEIAMRDFAKELNEKYGRRPGFYEWTMGKKDPATGELLSPSQLITEEYLTHLQKSGHKEGGTVKSFSQRVAEGLRMAVGGGVTNMSDTRPDITDGGQQIAAPFYAKGGPIKINFKGLRGRKPKRFEDGGPAAVDPFAIPMESDAGVEHTRRVLNEAGKALGEQYERDKKTLSTAEGRKDVANRILRTIAGGGPDLLNLAAKGVDVLQEQVPFLREPVSVMDQDGKVFGYTPKFALSSEKPVGGSEWLIEHAKQAGLIGENEAPLAELVGSLVGGTAVTKVPKVARQTVRGLNAASAAVQRPFTPATVTMEAVAPDLGKFKPRDWQETLTRRLTGEGAPVSMQTMGGLRTVKRPGQGVYVNEAGQLETNPMVAVDVPTGKSLSSFQPLRKSMVQAGSELGQESVAAHRFLPMLTNNINDATAMLIKPKGRNLTNEEVKQIGEQLGGMVVAHNPRLGGVVVYPFNLPKKGVPPELTRATDVASDILGKNAKITYGRVHPTKDTTYIPRAEYEKEGAKAPSAASQAMRARLMRAEARLFPERAGSPSGLP